MNKLSERLPKVWTLGDLPGYREHPEDFSTYSEFAYNNLPPVDSLIDDDFRWLKDQPVQSKWSLCDYTGEIARKLQAIQLPADLKFPQSFVNFMLSADLQKRVRSSTACYLELPDFPVQTVGAEDGYLVHFLSDQQWCYHWSLHINKAGEECVVGSEDAYGFNFSDEGGGNKSTQPPDSIDVSKEAAVFCASSFSEFMYRLWIENEIWFAINDKTPLTEEQRAFAEHYRQLKR